jgi:dolichyl-diphosphooligosaccharide--protein glycosyltransferase
MLCVLTLSLAPRVAQYRAWQAEPDRYFSNGVPVSSSDSYLWFRYADAYANDTYPEGRDVLRMFPTGAEVGDVPALSALMVWVSRALGLDVHRAGLVLAPLLSSLFVLPLGIYLFLVGAPLAGVLGALVGSFGTLYYERTTVAFVDTDGGNLFWFWLVALGMLLSSRDRWRGAVAAVAAGFAAHAFALWYAQPGLVLIFAAVLVAHLALARTPVRSASLRFALFVLCASPLLLFESFASVWEFMDRYLWSRALDPAAVSGPLVFPSVLSEIAELRSVGFVRALELASGNALLSAVGLGGFCLFAVQRPRALPPLLPLMALAALGFTSGQRFLMYTGPFVGIGIGTLCAWGLRRLAAVRPHLLSPLARDVAAYAATLILAVCLLPLTAFFQEAEARIRVEDLRGLQQLRERLPGNAALLHVWGRGYLVTAITGAATFNDGEDPDPVVEQLIDRGLTDADPRALYDIAAFLATHGRARIDAIASEAGSYAGLLKRIRGTPLPDDTRLFVLLTRYMLDTYPLIDRKGRHDFEAPEERPWQRYDVRTCVPLDAGLRCSKQDRNDILLDPERGRVNGRAWIHRLVRVEGGEVSEDRSFEPASGMWMQLVSASDADTELHILKSFVFESNFNQMYVLGRHDRRFFREVWNGYPAGRAFELLPLP